MPIRTIRRGGSGPSTDWDSSVLDVDALSDWDTPTESVGTTGEFNYTPPIPPVTEGPDLTLIGPYIPHTTVAGERWDTIAWNYYGDPTLFSGIVLANPGIPIEAQFEAGLIIRVPIIQQAALAAASPNLPPWKTI
jgi:phage tail protein X